MKLLCFLPLLAVVVHAQDVAAPDSSAVLKELDAIEQKQQQTRSSVKNQLLSRLQSAAQNTTAAAAFYTDAVEAVEFAGKKDKASEFNDWKRRNSDLLRSREMQAALSLYLRYAVLSVQRRDAEDPSTLITPTLAYVDDLVSADAVFKSGMPDPARDLLFKPLNESAIARWINLGDWLPEEKSWERKPGDLAGILQKNVRSELRKTGDPRLVQTWDLQIKTEAERITQGRSEHEALQFNTVTRPRLLFQRAQDLAAAGQPNRSATETLALIRAYPEHPDFASWVASLRDSLKSKETSAQ